MPMVVRATFLIYIFSLLATHPEHSHLELTATQNSGNIVGRVLAEGKPVADLDLHLLAHTEGDSSESNVVARTKTDLESPGQRDGLTLARIERDGRELVGGIEVRQGEHVGGLRLIFRYGTGSIRGRVILSGEIPESMSVRFRILASRKGEHREGLRFSAGTIEADRDGYFTLEGLIGGEYNGVSAGLAS